MWKRGKKRVRGTWDYIKKAPPERKKRDDSIFGKGGGGNGQRRGRDRKAKEYKKLEYRTGKKISRV